MPVIFPVAKKEAFFRYRKMAEGIYKHCQLDQFYINKKVA